MTNETSEILNSDASSLSKKGRKPLLGMALIILYVVLQALAFHGNLLHWHHGAFEADVNFIQGGATLTNEHRNFLVRELKIESVLDTAIGPVILLPLFFFGVRFLTGPNHYVWRWQQGRIKRHPLIAYILFFLGIVFLIRFIVRLLNPLPATQLLNPLIYPNPQDFDDRIFFSILALICLPISVWLYIGRRKKT
jgi:hypothetical protein